MAAKVTLPALAEDRADILEKAYNHVSGNMLRLLLIVTSSLIAKYRISDTLTAHCPEMLFSQEKAICMTLATPESGMLGKLFPSKPCLVYSFGSAADRHFENTVRSQLSCEVHTFDPSDGLAR